MQRHRKKIMRINYKDYRIEAIERETGCWRAKICRLDGRNIRVHFAPMEHASITTSIDTGDPQSSIEFAKSAVDSDDMT
jgi:hypothetical protein